MNCRSCGRLIPGDSGFCQYCGQSITGKAGSVQHQGQMKSSMSAGKIVAIVICVLVVASIVTAAVLYVMIQGFEVPRATTPTVVYSTTPLPVAWGWGISVKSITEADVSWSHVTILLTDGIDYCDWTPMAEDLDGGAMVLHDYGAATLGSLTISCNVSDSSGNGYVSALDCISVAPTGGTSFSSATTYTLVLVYEPTAEKMGIGATFPG